MNRFAALCLLAAFFSCGISFGDTFGSGANSFDIDFVTIANPGNPPDANPNPAGAVPYEYRIGKYEISEQMIDKANALGALGITKDTRGPDYPATSVSWYEAARFVNWLNTSSGSAPAYKFDGSGNFQLWTPSDAGFDSNNFYRNKLAIYFLPSVHEWHKAAYYNPSGGSYYFYPTGSDTVPDGIDFPGDPSFDAVFNDGYAQVGPNVITNVGIASPYGTFGQAGNTAEWQETAFDWRNDSPTKQRLGLGGGWGIGASAFAGDQTGGGIAPAFKGLGFRVAAITPEPSALVLVMIGLCGILEVRTRRS